MSYHAPPAFAANYRSAIENKVNKCLPAGMKESDDLKDRLNSLWASFSRQERRAVDDFRITANKAVHTGKEFDRLRFIKNYQLINRALNRILNLPMDEEEEFVTQTTKSFMDSLESKSSTYQREPEKSIKWWHALVLIFIVLPLMKSLFTPEDTAPVSNTMPTTMTSSNVVTAKQQVNPSLYMNDSFSNGTLSNHGFESENGPSPLSNSLQTNEQTSPYENGWYSNLGDEALKKYEQRQTPKCYQESNGMRYYFDKDGNKRYMEPSNLTNGGFSTPKAYQKTQEVEANPYDPNNKIPWKNNLGDEALKRYLQGQNGTNPSSNPFNPSPLITPNDVPWKKSQENDIQATGWNSSNVNNDWGNSNISSPNNTRIKSKIISGIRHYQSEDGQWYYINSKGQEIFRDEPDEKFTHYYEYNRLYENRKGDIFYIARKTKERIVVSEGNLNPPPIRTISKKINGIQCYQNVGGDGRWYYFDQEGEEIFVQE